MKLDANTPEILDFEKGNGLVPAVVQHARTGAVLMVGYMNHESLAATLHGGKAVFFSRSRQRLWEKGETSGHHLLVRAVYADCDRDAVLVVADPEGPTCHLGSASCFGEAPGGSDVGTGRASEGSAFLEELEAVIRDRSGADVGSSYTARLLTEGTPRIAQKVGEEGVETAIAAVSRDDAALVGEAADLVYHLLVLLRSRGLSLGDITRELERRHHRA